LSRTTKQSKWKGLKLALAIYWQAVTLAVVIQEGKENNIV